MEPNTQRIDAGIRNSCGRAAGRRAAIAARAPKGRAPELDVRVAFPELALGLVRMHRPHVAGVGLDIVAECADLHGTAKAIQEVAARIQVAVMISGKFDRLCDTLKSRNAAWLEDIWPLARWHH